ncbi:hypothetical protein G4Y79_18385 [Phototrophicus methaneseepsis]|uniref:B3/B4 tRNA-binding domain-containing protein n=1 Tax=Phototrophicus methaneseepsis TaxID=2710758 RepID=A0A7S8IDK3_9CHLR|nr:phenylalanine--tRNA ligase beta subunit-related protein [Phototrophicus methaneseepsis]QPC81642.1 hypothetical protein G4Y79_18385 [Phototrophicus methaneseepsis]
MPGFQYSQVIARDFPQVVGGVIYATGLSNGPSSTALLAQYHQEQQATLERIGDTPLSERPSLAAWRAAFRQFNVDPTKYRNAAEALLRRLTKKGDIPSINMLVDIGNMVAIRYALPIAMIDIGALQDSITVHYSDGTESFIDLGSDEPVQPEAGEVIFTDAANTVYARRWCWRQSAHSAARSNTQDILITIEAQHEYGRQDVEAALIDIRDLLAQHTTATTQFAILDSQITQTPW